MFAYYFMRQLFYVIALGAERSYIISLREIK